MWVVNSASATVQRFDPGTFEQGPLGTPIGVGLRPTAIAAGEGAIRVANNGADTVTRIDPGNAGAAPITEQIRLGDAPAGLAPARAPSGSPTRATEPSRASTPPNER